MKTNRGFDRNVIEFECTWWSKILLRFEFAEKANGRHVPGCPSCHIPGFMKHDAQDNQGYSLITLSIECVDQKSGSNDCKGSPAKIENNTPGRALRGKGNSLG